MTTTTVTTQAELDAALADADVTEIRIESPRGRRIEVRDTHGIRVYAYSGSTVYADSGSTVYAYSGSTVYADSGSTVYAYSGSTVYADSGSTVYAGSGSTVYAYSGSTVNARSGSTVYARSGSTVYAAPRTAVHRHDRSATINGGTVIDHTAGPDLTDAAAWCEEYGVEIVDGRATLYKAVGDQLQAGETYRRTTYAIGSEVIAPDWRDDHSCGGGLHLSPTAWESTQYRRDAARWLRCTVALADLRPIDGGGAPKAKCRSVLVVAEVDRHGRDLPASAPAGTAEVTS